MKLKLVTRSYIKIKKGRHLNNACLFLFYTPINYVLLALLPLFISCTSRDENVVEVVKEIEFNTSVGSGFPEIYYEAEVKQEVIYFIDKVKEKKIKFFSRNGNLLRTTPLEEALKNIDNIGRITVVSFDTIIINSNYTNEILITDRFGKIWKRFSLENSLIDSLGNQYELFSSVYPIVQNLNSLIFGLSWRNNLKDLERDTAIKTDVEELAYFNRESNKGAYFVNIKNITSKMPIVNYRYYGFYQNISPARSIIAESPSYFPIEGSIFINTLYSSSLYEISKEDFKAQKKILMSSPYTSIGVSPIILSKLVIPKIQDSITYKQKTSGRIEKILFDKLKFEYYIIVRHNSSVKEYDRNEVLFSIIVLNKDLSKKTEYNFSDLKYKYYYTLLSSDGLLLFKNDTAKSLVKNEKVTYNLVRLR